MVSQSSHSRENPMMSTSEILMLVNECDTAIEAAQNAVSKTYKVFDQEEIIGTHQCKTVIDAISLISKPFQKLYDKLGKSAQLLESVPPSRRLHLELYHVQVQAKNLRSGMSNFRIQLLTTTPQ